MARGKGTSAAPAASDSVPAEMTVPPTAAEKRAVIARRPRRRATDKARNDEGRDQLSADMQAVMQIYEKKMGVVGSSHFQKLRFWVEDMGMEGEVVAAAIEEAARNNSTRRMSYIGYLRNWHNEEFSPCVIYLKAMPTGVSQSDSNPSRNLMENCFVRHKR